MPQIDQIASTFASQLFWLALLFGFVYLVIGKGMLPKIQSTVEARDQQIAADLAEASKARAVADEIEDGWRARMAEARDASTAEVAAAKARASEASQKRLAEADRAAATQMAEAEQRIATARQGALASLDEVVAETSQSLVAKLTGVSVDANAAREAAKEALARG